MLFVFKEYIPNVANDENQPGEQTEQKQKGTDEEGAEQEEHPTNKKEDEVYWGVDSASKTTDELYACVSDQFGDPKVWGRYIGDNKNVSVGLTGQEADYLHSKDIYILLIYNHVTDARGYENGFNQAEEAVSLARSLDVPEGKAIFVDIEPGYPIDSEFLHGWYDGVKESVFEPGIYGVFAEEQNLYQEFVKAAQNVENFKKETLIWSAHPQAGITSQAKAPEYNAEAPEGSHVIGWQYGIDAKSCHIDTNLFKGPILDYLW